MLSKSEHLLTSERLFLHPLTYPQLVKYMLADDSLEEELHLTPSGRTISEEHAQAWQKSILPAVADPKNNFHYYTLWIICTKLENKMVGDLRFKGPPDENGSLEIGYGIYPSYQGNGYMTEAIGAMAKWAAAVPSVKAIIAETKKNNIASIRALEKNNFLKYKTIESMIWWRLFVK